MSTLGLFGSVETVPATSTNGPVTGPYAANTQCPEATILVIKPVAQVQLAM